jgi:hypothetical protein
MRPIVATRFLESHPTLSRTGWLAYASDQSGQQSVRGRSTAATSTGLAGRCH